MLWPPRIDIVSPFIEIERSALQGSGQRAHVRLELAARVKGIEASNGSKRTKEGAPDVQVPDACDSLARRRYLTSARTDERNVVMILIDGLPAYLLDDPAGLLARDSRPGQGRCRGRSGDDAFPILRSRGPIRRASSRDATPIGTASFSTGCSSGAGRGNWSNTSPRRLSKSWFEFRFCSTSSSRQASARRRSTGRAPAGRNRSTTIFRMSPAHWPTPRRGSRTS